MELAKKRVLVTGGTGFVGSHLVERLIAEGCVVRVLGNYQSQPSIGNLEFLGADELRSIELIWGDIRDRDSVMAAVEGMDVVFHLAALIGIPYSYVAPASYIATNITGTLNVLQACRARGVERLVHTSTSEVYGSAQFTPMDENHPLVGQSPYSATKIAADKLTESFVRSFELQAVTVRPFNIFGPRQSDRAVIPAIAAQVAAGKDPVMMGDPRPKRDFTYVTDTVDGFVRAARCADAIGRTVNMGQGESIAAGELATRMVELAGSNARIETDAERIRPAGSEVSELLCDATFAREHLGWQPCVTLTEGLRRTFEFVRSNPERFAPTTYRV